MSRQNYYQDLDLAVERVKGFLKIDFDDDTDVIRLLIESAREYIVDAIGYCDERIARILLLEYVIISEMYEKRSMTVSTDNMNTKVQYTIRSIINQLQLGDDENE